MLSEHLLNKIKEIIFASRNDDGEYTIPPEEVIDKIIGILVVEDLFYQSCVKELEKILKEKEKYND